MVELTGDFTPDLKLLQEADIVLTTPEKWDGISRSWKQRRCDLSLTQTHIHTHTLSLSLSFFVQEFPSAGGGKGHWFHNNFLLVGASYVRSVKLMVFDEIHLLGGDRGPILEVVCVSLSAASKKRSFPPVPCPHGPHPNVLILLPIADCISNAIHCLAPQQSHPLCGTVHCPG